MNSGDWILVACWVALVVAFVCLGLYHRSIAKQLKDRPKK